MPVQLFEDGSRMPVVLAAILAVADILAFVLYGVDKRKARRNAWRISEKALLVSALPGGIGAILGMKLFRHKTKKWYFRVWVGICAFLQVALLILMLL